MVSRLYKIYLVLFSLSLIEEKKGKKTYLEDCKEMKRKEHGEENYLENKEERKKEEGWKKE